MQLEIISRVPGSKAHPNPLLFVHGAWHSAWCWDVHFLPYFAAHGYAAYGLSLRGHGRSAGRERVRWYRIADYLADVAEVVKQLPGPPVLVGHSMGGWIVQKYIEQYAAPAAILLAPMSAGGSTPFLRQAVRRYPLAIARLMFSGKFETQELVQAAFFSPATPSDLVEAYFPYFRDQAESFLVMPEISSGTVTPRTDPPVPVLVLGASDDATIAQTKVEATARRHNTQAEILPNLSHSMMLDPGWPCVADHMLTWLRTQGL